MGEEAEVEREILQDRMISLVVLEEGEVINHFRLGILNEYLEFWCNIFVIFIMFI